MTQCDARQGFDLDVFQSGALNFRKAADLRLGEFDVLDRLGRDCLDQTRDLVIAEAESRWRPFVEFFRQGADSHIPLSGDIGKDRFDGRAHPGVFFA